MSEHIQVVKDALEFNRPAYLPMEIVDVPHIYNAYHTLDPNTVTFIPGTEQFDMLWPNCYSWFFTDQGQTAEGEPIRYDQFGNIVRVPKSQNTSYVILKNALADIDSLEDFVLPDPAQTDQHYEQLGKVIRNKYPDRFINAYIDAGFFLTSLLLLGESNFLIKLADDPKLVVGIYERVVEYYKALTLKFKKAGAHMITVIEDIGSTSSLLISPTTWRTYFKPILTRFYKFVHDNNMYTGILIDGNSSQVHEDLLHVGLDLFSVVDIETTGIETVRKNLKGKICIKASVDMQTVLAQKSPKDVEKQAHKLVAGLNDSQGGFICYVVRWHRPQYPEQNVLASVKAFNTYRTT
jgi:uroporphyrinogen-III decarboxylase